MKAKSLGRNTVALFLMNVVSALMMLALTIAAARILGSVGFGKYAFTLAYASFFGVLIPLGLDVILTREVAKDRSRVGKYLGNSVLMGVASSVSAYVLMVLLVNLLNYPADTKTAVYFLGLYIVFTSVSRFFKGVFQAYERMEYQALVEASSKLVLTVLGLYMLISGRGLVGLAFAFMAGGAVDLALSYVVCQGRFSKIEPCLDIGLCGRLTGMSLPILMAYGLNFVYFKADVFLLSIMKGDAVVGWYSAPYQIVSGLTMVSASFVSAVFPVMSRLHARSKANLNDVYGRSLKYLTVIGLPMAVGTMILAKPITLAFFGVQYSNSVVALEILIWAELFLFLNNTTGIMLNAVDRQEASMYIIMFGAVLNILLNLMLIPSMSYVGSAFSILTTQFSVLAAGMFYLARLGYSPKVGYVPKLLACTILMGAVTALTSQYGLFSSIAVSAAVYVCLIVSSKSVAYGEVRDFFLEIEA